MVSYKALNTVKKVREDAIGIPVIGKGEVYNFYNIDQKDYLIKNARQYN